MKLVPVVLNDLPIPLNPVEWRFKKHKYKGKILYRKAEKDYIFEIDLSAFKKYHSLDDKKSYSTLEEARKAAENWLDLYWNINGRLITF